MTVSAKGAPAVETLYEDYVALREEVRDSASGLAAVNRTYNKHLLVAAASSLEDYVKELVPEMFVRRGNRQLGLFVAQQVFARGYHTLFGWKDGTAQPFFSSFGLDCRNAFRAKLREEPDFAAEHDAFMLLGRLRNEVVHNDYATTMIDYTPDEIIEKYRFGLLFVARFEDLIHVDAGQGAGESQESGRP